MTKEITRDEFRQILPGICDRETSADPDRWTPDNPLWGHCAVVSVLAHNFFGGQLWRASIEKELGGSHYWLQMSDGCVEDFTKVQFGGQEPVLRDPVKRDRSYVLDPKFESTVRRYKLLAWRLAKALYPAGVEIFKDPLYHACFLQALASPCRKMKFGCVITLNGEVVAQSCNKTIEPLRSMCQPQCIRMSITSRTESMLGACGHAEEWALWNAVHKNVPLKDCEVYVAGLYANGLPWFKTAADHTCLRCAVQMYHAKIGKIWVPVCSIDREASPHVSIEWQSLSAEQAVETARAYAMQEKTVHMSVPYAQDIQSSQSR